MLRQEALAVLLVWLLQRIRLGGRVVSPRLVVALSWPTTAIKVLSCRVHESLVKRRCDCSCMIYVLL